MIHVISLKYVGGLDLELEFDDETAGVANLAELVERVPLFAPLSDQALFARAFVEDGRVCWPGEIDISAERLYALAHHLPPPDSLEQAHENERVMHRRQTDPGRPPRDS
ncbi:MAG TPA: DUF2442 domain-containing protein [Polyangiales bacterium]